MNVTVVIRKLSRPVRTAPSATLVAIAKFKMVDGSTEEQGTWYGTDREELTARVNLWLAQYSQPVAQA